MIQNIPIERLKTVVELADEKGADEASRILGVTTGTIRRYRNEIKNRNKVKPVEEVVCTSKILEFDRPKEITSDEVIGIVGDLHTPFDHPNYLQFCIDTFKKYGVTKVVFIGDLVDGHAISFHQSETSALSPTDEYSLAKRHVKKYVEAFPDAVVTLGNHDKIPVRQLATLGIPEIYLKSYNDLWEIPKTWQFVEEIIINDVYYFHGTGSTGKTPAFNRALYNRMSTVQGHAHSAFGCMYNANARDIIFGLDVGCGILADAYAFAYGKPFPKKPILGCGVVFSSSQALAIPMGEKYFR
jgi:hypothetical protein